MLVFVFCLSALCGWEFDYKKTPKLLFEAIEVRATHERCLDVTFSDELNMDH